MLKKISPDQLKFGILVATLIYLVNGQDAATSAKPSSINASSRSGAVALAASPGSPSNNLVNLGCNNAQRRVQVAADAVLNLRSYPNGPVLKTLAPGTSVTAQSSDGTWSEVTTNSGERGWTFNQYLGCG